MTMPTLTYRAGGASVTELRVDLDRLVASRLLIQANSGGGKSRAIRQLLEETHGRIPHLVLDPEGEFASLRERFDYVHAAKVGGDVALLPKHAKVLCRRLVELGASAVLDLYELPKHERREFVKLFLTELVNLPRTLWRPLLVIIDEAHEFAPERGSGEAASTEAVIGLCTLGRKRGFCAVLATQRISKLHKDAAAELNNKLIGRTGLDVDVKRAGDELGFGKEERAALKTLRPGEFFAYGPAIAPSVTQVKTGAVVTTHPEAGRVAQVAPPAPKAVQALLAQLKDLPAEAEAEARTLDELKKENAGLRLEVKRAKAAPAPEVKVETVIDEAAIAAAVDAERQHWTDWRLRLENALRSHESALTALFAENAKGLADRRAVQNPGRISTRPSVARSPSPRPTPRAAPAPATPRLDGELSGPQQRILDALAWFETIGITEPLQVGVAFLANYTAGAGAYNNVRAQLKARGMLEYRGTRLALTDYGRQHADIPSERPTTAALQRVVLEKLDGPGRRLLEPLLEAWPDPMDKTELAELAGYTAGAGAFNNACGRLRSLGLVDYPAAGRIRAEDLLFPEHN